MNKRLMFYLLALIVAAIPVGAQVRFGVRGGMTVGELRFDRDIIDSDNRVGYCGGLLVDAGIPVVGLGIEASVMYTHRNNYLSDQSRVFKRYYIDIPVYARYRLDIPGLRKLFAPIVYTGPAFSILFNDNGPSTYDNSKTYVSWDAGLGADVFNHLRVTATYGIGISKAMHYIERDYDGNTVDGRDRYWTLSAAWLF